MRRIVAVALITGLCSFDIVVAQQAWVEHGPRPNSEGQVENITDNEVVGAIQAIALHPADADVIYAAAVNGGIWRTSDGTAASPSWTNVFPTIASSSMGAIAFDPTDATNQTIVAGSGRFSNFGRRGADRIGIARTTDDGANWVTLDGGGTIDGLNISGVAPRGATIVISADDADAAGNSGIWRSINTGGNFTQISGAPGTGLPAGPAYDLAGDPSDNTRLYTNAGTNGIYRSDDSGGTWAKVSDAAIDGAMAGTQSVRIAVGTSNNVYVAIESGRQLSALFRSGNSGGAWTALDTPTTTEAGVAVGIHPGRQGRSNLSLTADASDANIVYIGGDRQPYLNEFTTGLCPCFPNSIGANEYSGRLFRVDASLAAGSQAAHITHSNTASASSPHADSRDMAIDANGDLIEVDDGGIYRRTDPQLNTGDWFSVIGDIAVTELHDVAWDANAKIMIGGAQDTGTPEEVLSANPRWRSVSTADGGDVAVDDIGTPGTSVRYSSNQRLGNFRRRTYDAANAFQAEVFPGLTVLAGGNPLIPQFTTPIELNNVDPTRMIIGGGNLRNAFGAIIQAGSVYESTDQGNTITEIGPGVVANAGDADPIAYGAAGNADMLYVGAGSQVFVRTAAPPAALNASAAYAGGTVAAIAIDPDDPQTAYVIDDDNVFQTTNAGTGWNDVTGNLQALNPGDFRSIAYSTSGTDDAVIVGTDVGVFAAEGPAFNVWAALGSGIPPVPVYDLEYDATDEILVAGLLGRGAWSLNLGDREPVDIALVLDLSGSMLSPACATCDPKLDILKDAVEIFVQLWTVLTGADDRIGVNYFRTNVDELSIPPDFLVPVLPSAATVISDVRGQTTVPANLTAMGGGLQAAINRLTDPAPLKNIILFTDGMQNVNPKVLEIDDSPPAGAFHLEIDDDPADPDVSNIPVTTPPTQLDAALDVKIHTIGVGATPPFVDLLNKVASETDGVSKLTTAPDEDLRQFYVEELIDALRDFSPQLIDYRRGVVSAPTTTEAFEVNNTATKLVLKLSTSRSDSLTFRVEKNGIDVTRVGHTIDGPFYRIFAIDLPATIHGTPIDAGGTWTMNIAGQPGTTYEAAAIVDEPSLEYDFSIGGRDLEVGETIPLEARLEFNGLPVTNANVSGRLLSPGQGLGTLLSLRPTPSAPAGFPFEAGTSGAQHKLHLLMMDTTFANAVRPVGRTIAFQNVGNGTYSADITGTAVPGTYTVIFDVDGFRPDIGTYRRTERRSTSIRFGNADPARSTLIATLIDKTSVSVRYELQVRPLDRLGNYLGPDYGHKIELLVNGMQVATPWVDNLDGSYTGSFSVPVGTDPRITVNVMDHPLYDGPLSSMPGASQGRLALSAHIGVGIPLGDFDNSFDLGPLIELDLEYRLRPQISLEGVLGRYSFDPSYNVLGASVYLKGYMPARTVRPWIAGGAGIFDPDHVDPALGLSASVGLNQPINSSVEADVGVSYFHIFSSGDGIDFIAAKAGIKVLF